MKRLRYRKVVCLRSHSSYILELGSIICPAAFQGSTLARTKLAAVGAERSVSFQIWLVSRLDRTG